MVNLIVSELAVFDVGRPGLTLVDKAPDVSVEEIRAKTEAAFERASRRELTKAGCCRGRGALRPRLRESAWLVCVGP